MLAYDSEDKRRFRRDAWSSCRGHFWASSQYFYGNANNYGNFRLFSPHCQNLRCLRGHLKNWLPTGVLSYKSIVAHLFKKFFTFCGTEMFIAVFETEGHWSLSWTTWIQSTLSLKSCSILFSSTYSFSQFSLQVFQNKLCSFFWCFFFFLPLMKSSTYKSCIN